MRFKFHLLHATLLISALQFISPSWGADVLTLAGAQRLALDRSRQLNAQDAVISASRERAVAAAQLPDPVVKLGIDNLPIDGPDSFSLSRDFMTMRRIGVMQEMTRADKRELKRERFEREAEKSLAEKSFTTANIERDTALAWLDRYYLEAMTSAMADEVHQAQLEIEAAESAYRAGRGSQVDVFAAKSALAMIKDRASEIKRQSRTAQITLTRWIGKAAEAPLADAPDMNVLRLQDHLLESHLQNHPEIMALTKQEEIAAIEARLAAADKRSDWSWEVAYQQRGSAYSNMISVGIAIPLQWDQRNRQDREVAAKLAIAEEAKARRDEMLREHVADIRAMIEAWENARERRARYQRELLPLSVDRTQAALAAYRGGKTNLSDVLTARRGEIETRLQALQLDLEIARLWARINFILPDDTTALAAQPLKTLSKELP